MSTLRMSAVDVAAPYLFDSLSDRERLYQLYDLLHLAHLRDFDRALSYAGLSTDPLVACWRLLDVGCGQGLHLADTLERYPLIQALGLDRDPEAIRAARTSFSSIRDLHVLLHDIQQPLPRWVAPAVPGSGFDIAQMLNTVSHMPDARSPLLNVAHAVRPGGVLLVVDPVAPWIEHPDPSVARLGRAVEDGWRRFGTHAAGDRHLELLERAGFEVLESRARERELGGDSDEGQRLLALSIAEAASLRRALVEAAGVISHDELDLHLGRLQAEQPPRQAGALRTRVTIARRPG